MLGGLTGFVALAASVAIVGTLFGVAALRLAGRRAGVAGTGLALLTLFFLALTQLPFPDPATMVCPINNTTPRLMPFRFAGRTVTLLSQPATLPQRLLDVGVLSAMMNLVICVGMGALLARWTAKGAVFALIWGATLSLSVELTQLTGFWGLFPCAWRLFDVDDLILNIAGVMIGFQAVRWKWSRPYERM